MLDQILGNRIGNIQRHVSFIVPPQPGMAYHSPSGNRWRCFNSYGTYAAFVCEQSEAIAHVLDGKLKAGKDEEDLAKALALGPCLDDAGTVGHLLKVCMADHLDVKFQPKTTGVQQYLCVGQEGYTLAYYLVDDVLKERTPPAFDLILKSMFEMAGEIVAEKKRVGL